MNCEHALLLLMVPGLPLLLAIPVLRRQFPWSIYIALLPVVMLLISQANFEVELPWMFLGNSSLAVNELSRWWLAMSVVAWLVAATALYLFHDHDVDNSRLPTFFLLCLSGQLGAILANDIVSFFAFSSLMSYAFYGLMADGGGAAAKRAGRVFLVMLVIADIVLFEALLIAASATHDLEFSSIASGVEKSTSFNLYLSLVFVGFALKAGFWPFHVWLPLAYASANRVTILLLWIVPAATGLLGIIRWIPFGDIVAPVLGILLQGIGVGAMLFALIFALRQVQPGQIFAYAIIMVTGSIVAVMGISLADPVFWEQYGRWLPLGVTFIGWGLTAVIISPAWMRWRHTPADGNEELQWYERWPQAVLRQGGQAGYETLPGLYASWSGKWRNFRFNQVWQRVLDVVERGLRLWTSAIVLFLLLAMLITIIHFGFQYG